MSFGKFWKFLGNAGLSEPNPHADPFDYPSKPGDMLHFKGDGRTFVCNRYCRIGSKAGLMRAVEAGDFYVMEVYE